MVAKSTKLSLHNDDTILCYTFCRTKVHTEASAGSDRHAGDDQHGHAFSRRWRLKSPHDKAVPLGTQG